MQRSWLAFILPFLVLTSAMGQSEKDIQSLAERLTRIADSLKRPETMMQDLENHLDNLRILKALREELDAVRKLHGASMKTSRGQGPFHKLDIAWNYADREMREYQRYASMVATPQAVTQELENAMRLARLAVENKAPAYFLPDNSLQRHLSQAALKLKAFQAFDPKSASITSLQEQLAATRKQINGIQAGMKVDILKGNKMPPDDYHQADRGALITLLNEKWAQEGNGKQVLKVGIITTAWTRKVYWQRVGTDWHLTDQSRLQGYIIVRQNDQVAVRHSINLMKDHMAQDRLSASFLNDPKHEPELVNMLMLAKVK